MLNIRKAVSRLEGEVTKHEGMTNQIVRLLLPPFVIYLTTWIWDLLKRTAKDVWGRIWQQGLVQGPSSKQFHRRRYQPHFQSIKLQSDQLGFTNQVLVQGGKKSINYYLPVYVTNKIKSIQDVSVQTLTGNISCAVIINVFHEGIPTEIVDRLENSMIVQLNRGQAIRLEDDGITITVKRDKKKHFLIFTLRKVFLAFLLSDPLWSPFELVELVISITLNTVTIKQHSLNKQYQNSTYNPEMEYKISFNCMRNSDQIPVSYALDCVFGIYDLAQRKLDVYSSNKGSYSEIIKSYEQYQAKQLRKRRGIPNASPKQIRAKAEEEQRVAVGLMGMLAQSIMGRLSLRPSPGVKKKAEKKVKYFQYSHFIIPLYKYPGNSLATIFIPVFLLALVSLAIFFQEPELASRIGAIATMVLGYIALIPSIKQELPPSSKLTVIEAVVYIETLCCLLCLFQSFQIGGDENYVFVWYTNLTYLTCLIIHFGTFFFILGVYAMHKLVWEPDYNSDQKVIEVKPSDARESWDNPFCDEVFIKFNKEIMGGKYSDKQKQEMLIRPLMKPQMELSKLPSQNNLNFFQQLLNFPDTSRKSITDPQPDAFETPNADLYFSTSLSKTFSEI